MRNNFSFLNVYKKTKKSEVVTQLLYGDTFKKIKKIGPLIKIKNDLDGYAGYIINKKFPSNQKNTHKIFVLCASLYSKPSLKNKINKKLSYGSKISVTNNRGIFYKFDNLWIKKKDLKKINYKKKDFFRDVKIFKNAKYKWGGKHFSGIDCSALIQIFFNFNNKFCPRDTKDQIKFFKKKVSLDKIKKNDLIFWKGHVAIVLSKKKLIHAYGPYKKVVIMNIKKTLDRIKRTAKLDVIGVRRVI